MGGVRPPAKCGTDGGYFRHKRTLREPACDEVAELKGGAA